MMKSIAKTPWLFYALVIYVLLQFIWWEVLLTRQNSQLAEEQKKISALHFADKDLLEQNIKEIDRKKDHRLWMHVSEGTVFLILLSLGVLKIYNTRKKENELVRLQSNFLLSVTHELKSPLASVKLQLQTMQKYKLDELTQHALIQKALADNERLQRMIDNVLLASKTENGNNILNLKKINLTETLSKLIEQAFEDNKHRINLIHTKAPSNYPEGGEHILATPLPLGESWGGAANAAFTEADESIVSIIFSNLVENAIKYSPEKTPIEIKLKQEQGKTIVTVSDNGTGIPDNEKGNVFTKFYRIGNEETRTAKGTGLGLYIVKSLADLHHIQISIVDNKPKGCVFTLVFSS